MTLVPVRELRNHTADVIQRVRDGQDVTITANGVAVATLVPVRTVGRDTITRAELLKALRGKQADAGLRADLAILAGDTTDDLGPIR